MMHLLAATKAAAFQRRSVMEQFIFWFCETCHCWSDLSLKHWAKSSWWAAASGSWKRLC